jgi:ligand-binding SRPBCC domain-containing protein
MTPFVLDSDVVLPIALADAFAFFADAANLERITPPWLHFVIKSPLPIDMHEGAGIEYRIRWHGVPLSWSTRIDRWDPPSFFVDRQVRGPYRLWRHEHRFEAVDGGTRVRDRVEYVPPLRWLSSGIVVRDVERIFAYRRHELLRLAASGEIYDPSG